MPYELDRRHHPALAPVESERDGFTPAPYAAALDFAEETVREAQRARRRAWTIAGILILICAVQAAAIALLLPLKDVVPYTIVVDKQTGYVEAARGVDIGTLKDDRAVVESFLAQYVLQRETFDTADFEDRYRRVALWSIDQARNDYIESYRAGAPQAIFSQVRPGTTIRATIKNIELLTPTTARVRFDLTRRDPGLDPVTSDWQTLVVFRFTGEPMRTADRLINPLGFQVTSYRRDGEWEAPAAVVAPAPEITATTVVPADAQPAAAAPPTTPPQTPVRMDVGPTK